MSLATAPIGPSGVTRRGAARDLSSVVAVALHVAVALLAVRVTLPILYTYRGDAGLSRTVIVLVAVFASPAVVVLLVRRAPGRVLVCFAAMAAALFVAVQLVDEIPLILAATTSAAALVTLTLALTVVPASGPAVALGLVTGLALDTVIRGAWTTWDAPWRAGVAAALTTTVLAVAAVGGAVLTRRSGDRDAHVNRAGAVVALGPFLALQVLMLQSPAFVASSLGVSLEAAIAFVLVVDVAAIFAIVLVSASAEHFGRLGVAACGGVLAVSAFVLTATNAPVAAVLLFAAQVSAVALFTLAAARRIRTDGSHAASVAAGWVSFIAVLLLYQVHYETPLPVSNRWLPVIAAVLLACAVIGGAPARVAAASAARRSARQVSIAIVLAAALVWGGLGLTGSEARVTSASSSLRVMTYNVDETVTRHGQLDPENLAREVEALQPDVLVVEETGRGWLLSSTMDLAEWARRRLGMPYVWGPAADGQFGNMLLSRVPVRDARVASLPRGAGRMRRSAIVAHVGPVGGHVVTVIGAHLQDGHTPASHATRVVEANALLHEWAGAPYTVIAGDLNSDPGSPELRTLLAAGFSTTQPAEQCTLTTSNQNCVDWILVTPDLEQGMARTVPDETYDHRPLFATVSPR